MKRSKDLKKEKKKKLLIHPMLRDESILSCWGKILLLVIPVIVPTQVSLSEN